MKYLNKYGSLFSEFYENHGLICLLYYLVFASRILIFSINQLFLSQFEYLQKSLNLTASVFFLIYLAIVKPFKVKEILISNIYSEFTNVSIFLTIMLRDYLFQNGFSEFFDTVFIGLIISEIIFQYLVILYILCKKIKYLCYQYRNSRQADQESINIAT